jgi:hypothetical protein
MMSGTSNSDIDNDNEATDPQMVATGVPVTVATDAAVESTEDLAKRKEETDKELLEVGYSERTNRMCVYKNRRICFMLFLCFASPTARCHSLSHGVLSIESGYNFMRLQQLFILVSPCAFFPAIERHFMIILGTSRL